AVTVEGVTRSATVDSDGNWAATFEAGSLPAGEYDTTVSVTSTDTAGNTASATASLHVDTVVDPITLDSGVEGDDIVNETERSDGVTLTGTVEPGSTVVVQLGSATETATVDASGNWSVDFAASDIPQGSYDADVVVTATDAAGNTAEINDTLAIDTEVSPFTADSVTDDDALNLAERAAGLTMTGTVEPGSDVKVTIQGVTRTASVDADGNWSATFAADDLLAGTYTATAEIEATDAAGNTDTLTETFSVDTEYDAPNIGSVISTGTSVSGFFSDDYESSDTVHELTSGGAVSDVTGTETDLGGGNTLFNFDSDVPDGSHL
ncbi:Ig-like domain-containing protein, partial [Leisingera sp. ANG-Vp]|uniref:Ig-like domain-containing protein n=1 Tax=Leisingera sp. ANG-Vp TaxID=1577896 RepID=UPI00057DAEF1